jgi:predicted esterase
MFTYKKSIILSALLAGAQPASLNIKQLSNDWSDVSYKDQEYQTRDFNLQPKSFTLSGFSSGAFLTTSLFSLFHENIDGIAVLSGGGPIHNFNESADFENKPAYFYTGTSDDIVFQEEISLPSSVIFKNFGANVKTNWIEGFEHVFPNDV